MMTKKTVKSKIWETARNSNSLPLKKSEVTKAPQKSREDNPARRGARSSRRISFRFFFFMCTTMPRSIPVNYMSGLFRNQRDSPGIAQRTKTLLLCGGSIEESGLVCQ